VDADAVTGSELPSRVPALMAPASAASVLSDAQPDVQPSMIGNAVEANGPGPAVDADAVTGTEHDRLDISDQHRPMHEQQSKQMISIHDFSS
jgi:hypothetical protein